MYLIAGMTLLGMGYLIYQLVYEYDLYRERIMIVEAKQIINTIMKGGLV